MQDRVAAIAVDCCMVPKRVLEVKLLTILEVVHNVDAAFWGPRDFQPLAEELGRLH